MPELPEVETVRRQIAPHVAGRRIRRADVHVPRVARPDAVSWRERVEGRRIVEVQRRGKLLYLPLDDGAFMLIHLGMTGHVQVRSADAPDPLPPHVTASWHLDDGGRLFLTDPRTFGFVGVSGDLSFLQRFGPEPLGATYDPAALAARLGGHGSTIKAVLLDQSVVAGVGSIYADETLFLARVHPLSRARDVSPAALLRVATLLREVLERAVSARGATFDGSRYQDVFGQPGEFPTAVYAREGSPCVRCGAVVQRGRLGQGRKARSCHFCPRCQRPARPRGTSGRKAAKDA